MNDRFHFDNEHSIVTSGLPLYSATWAPENDAFLLFEADPIAYKSLYGNSNQPPVYANYGETHLFPVDPTSSLYDKTPVESLCGITVPLAEHSRRVPHPGQHSSEYFCEECLTRFQQWGGKFDALDERWKLAFERFLRNELPHIYAEPTIVRRASPPRSSPRSADVFMRWVEGDPFTLHNMTFSRYGDDPRDFAMTASGYRLWIERREACDDGFYFAKLKIGRNILSSFAREALMVANKHLWVTAKHQIDATNPPFLLSLDDENWWPEQSFILLERENLDAATTVKIVL